MSFLLHPAKFSASGNTRYATTYQVESWDYDTNYYVVVGSGMRKSNAVSLMMQLNRQAHTNGAPVVATYQEVIK